MNRASLFAALAALCFAGLTASADASARRGAKAPNDVAAETVRHVEYGSQEDEFMTIFPAAEAEAPTVLLVHGGAWHDQKDETEREGQAMRLQTEGFSVFDVNYPQDTAPIKAAFPTEPEAIVHAARWAIANGSAYNADPQNVILLGGSAGGQLVAMAADRMDAETPGAIKGVVSLSGPMDLESLAGELQTNKHAAESLLEPLSRVLGCRRLVDCSEAFAREWSPVDNIPPASACPAWLLFGSRTDIVPLPQQQEMADALTATGCSVALTVTPHSHSWAYWSRVKPEVLAFIRSH
jgi:acetyl esterase/lipase